MQVSQPILSVQELTIAFGDAPPVVTDLSFDLHPGQTLALVGESGSGKSLTALSLLGLLPASARIKQGKLLWTPAADSAPTELSGLTEQAYRPLRSKEIGMIFQEPLTALNPTQRIGKQLAENIRGALALKDRNEILKVAEAWLEKVKLPDPSRVLRAYPHQLSGGQRQRVLIAMAMLTQPKLLIADEPTTALDTVTEAEIITLLRELTQEKNTALLFISHDLAVVRHLADEVILLRAGKIVEQGPTENTFNAPREAYTKRLIQLSPRLNFSPSQPSNHPQNEPEAPAAIALSVQDLSIAYPLTTNWLGRPTAFLRAVDKVSFQLHKGELVALVGESGCGKSSLMRGIVGLQPIVSGKISPKGRKVQIVFQDPFSSLNPVLSIGSVLMEVVRHLHPQWNRQQQQARTEELLSSVELHATEFYDRLPAELSGGQRQRVAIARALAAEPEVLICDEAVSALDAALQSNIMQLLQRIRHEMKVGILFISHDLALVSSVADRIFVMDNGQIVEHGSPEKLLKNPQSSATIKLLAAILPL